MRNFFLIIRRPPRSTPQSSRRQRQMCIRDSCHNPDEPKETGGQMECDMRDCNLAKTKEI